MGNTLSEYEKRPCEVKLSGHLTSLQGVQFDQKAQRYVNIPYALPPTGSHRWRPPRPIPSPSQGSKVVVLDCTTFGKVCPQWLGYTTISNAETRVGVEKDRGESPYEFDEDCLKLNIWTPVPSEENKGPWPVLVWLHGGWFQLGNPSQDSSMDPTELISMGNFNGIVVAIGYRLNIFGFLAGQALRDENEGTIVGNYGLWDARLAMEWVKLNISAFGGDPDNITLAGRSAGAFAVHALTLYDFRLPEGERKWSGKLFHRIILFSNAIPAQPKTLKEAQPQFNEVCNYFGIDLSISGAEILERLRKISSNDLVKGIKNLKHHTFRPLTDGVFVKPGLFEYHKSGQFGAEFKKRGLKILLGEMLNEETLYAATNPPQSPNVESLQLQLENYYPSNAVRRIISYYDLPETEDLEQWKLVFGRILSDGQVRASIRALVDSLSSNGVTVKDIWRYKVNYRLSFINDKIVPYSFGVAHGMDTPFWNFSILHGPTAEERILMKDWIQNLIAFTKDDTSYLYGTTNIDEFKVITPEGKIEIQSDERYQSLLKLSHVISGE